MPPPSRRDDPAADLVARTAGWWARAVAHLVDSVLTLTLGLPLVVVGAIRWVQDVEWPDDQEIPTGFDPTGYAMVLGGLALLVAIQVLHAVVLQARTGWTVGKLVVGLRLVGTDGARVRVRSALGRWAAWVMILFVPLAPLLDVLWPLWNPHRQTLHDQMAHTLVVRR